MKGITGVLVGALIVLLVIVAVVVLMQGDDELGENEGRIYFGITDAAADMGTINEVEMEIESVEVYSAAEGWTIVSSDSRTYALLRLNAEGSVELYDVGAVAAGTYDRVRVTLGDVVIDSETEGRVEAVLPSEQITFNTQVVVEEGSDSHVTLDFIANESLHVSSDGIFVFAPVVEAEARSGATVSVDNNNKVTVSGGRVDGTARVGVDLDGSTKANFRLDSSAGLDVETSALGGGATFKLGGQTIIGGSASGEGDAGAQGSTNAGGSASGSASGGANAGASSETNVEAGSTGDGASVEGESSGELEVNL